MRRLEASCAEGHALPVQKHPLGRLRERECRECKIESAHSQRRKRKQGADRRRNEAAAGKGDPEWPAEMHLQQARRIGTDAEHRGVGERELPRIADKNVQPDR